MSNLLHGSLSCTLPVLFPFPFPAKDPLPLQFAKPAFLSLGALSPVAVCSSTQLLLLAAHSILSFCGVRPLLSTRAPFFFSSFFFPSIPPLPNLSCRPRLETVRACVRVLVLEYVCACVCVCCVCACVCLSFLPVSRDLLPSYPALVLVSFWSGPCGPGSVFVAHQTTTPPPFPPPSP